MKEVFIGCWLIYLLAVPAPSLQAQSVNTQFWFEYMLNYPFANSYNIENAFVYSTLADSPRWRSFDYTPTLEYSLDQTFDFMVGCTFSYTAQTDDYNTFELRPSIGTRVNITPHRRLQSRILVRLEQRNFLNLDTDEWEDVLRPRIRVEGIYPINKKSYFEDALWYCMADFEWLFSDDDVEERFANRFRARIGVGYRLNQSSRFEFIYMNQQSKSGIEEDFSSSDNIFRFRYKHFLRKTIQTKTSGSVN